MEGHDENKLCDPPLHDLIELAEPLRGLRGRRHPCLVAQQAGTAGHALLDQLLDDIRFGCLKQRIRVPRRQPLGHLTSQDIQTCPQIVLGEESRYHAPILAYRSGKPQPTQ